MTTPIYLVTGNANKLRELQPIFADAKLLLKAEKLDLDELQNLDLDAIITHKLKQAHQQLGAPVIVEDVSAELENLNGLPGPFIKFFEQRLGNGALYKLSSEGTPVVIRCKMGYFDGRTTHIAEGVMKGTITAPRGENGFGFDSVIMPEGDTMTLAELGPAVKNTISHRYQAAQALVKMLHK